MTVRKQIKSIIWEYKEPLLTKMIKEILSIKVIRGCPVCDGYKSTYTQFSSDAYMDCPACNGTGTQTKTIKEILEEGKWK